MSDLLMITLLVLLGPCLLAYGIWILRQAAWKDSVPLAEVLLDRAFGVEPPPRNVWDRRFALLQAWFMTAFGAFVTLGGIAILVSDFLPE